MLEAERTPILIDGGTKKAKKRSKAKENGMGSGWIERRIYINAKYQSKSNTEKYTPLNKDDKELKSVHIQGFLRNQPYGPNNKLRKWIYVEGFESHRWSESDSKHTRIIIDTKY
jgi:hypothetical protein